MQIDVIASPQTPVHVKLHTVTSQTWDLNILCQLESHIEYIPACRIIVSLSSGSGKPRTIVAPCYYNILTGHGDKILNSHVDISHPCAQCITLMLWMKCNLLRVLVNVKVVAVCLLHTKLIWQQRYFQLWHCVVWQISTDISEYLLPPSSGLWRQQVPLWWCYLSTGLQWLNQGVKQHHYHNLVSLRSHFIWHSTSPWNHGRNLIDMRL